MHNLKIQELSRRLKEGTSFEDLVWEIEIIYLIRECFNLHDPAGIGDFGQPHGSPAEEYDSESAMLFDLLMDYHLNDRKLLLNDLNIMTDKLLLEMFSELPVRKENDRMNFSRCLYGELNKMEVNYENRNMIRGKAFNLTIQEEYDKL